MYNNITSTWHISSLLFTILVYKIILCEYNIIYITRDNIILHDYFLTYFYIKKIIVWITKNKYTIKLIHSYYNLICSYNNNKVNINSYKWNIMIYKIYLNNYKHQLDVTTVLLMWINLCTLFKMKIIFNKKIIIYYAYFVASLVDSHGSMII